MTEIDHAHWLEWHGKGGKSVARLKALDASLLTRQGYESSTLWWNLRRLYCYIDNNAGTLVNYGARYRKGLPISSSIVNSRSFCPFVSDSCPLAIAGTLEASASYALLSRDSKSRYHRSAEQFVTQCCQ